MDDKTLYGRVVNNDKEAFGVLVHRYFVMLYLFVVRIVGDSEASKDIVQELFIRLWENRHRTSPGTSVRGYLLVSARNAAYNHNRLHRGHDSLDSHPELNERELSLGVIEDDANRQLLAAIGLLPPRSAEAILLSLEGLRQEAIAERMQITVAGVKALKSTGIKRLKELLKPMLFLLSGGL